MTVLDFKKEIRKFDGLNSEKILAIVKICLKNKSLLDEFRDSRDFVQNELLQYIRAANHDIELCLENNFAHLDGASKSYVLGELKAVYKATEFLTNMPIVRNK